MSFSLEIIDELVSREYEKTCCKKAFIFGVFFGFILTVILMNII